jgi:multidrug transporter EmrE-like cation transporter
MSEIVETPVVQEERSSEKYKTLIVILTVFTTVLAAVLAALQSDASIRADIANRDSQYLAIQASGELHRAGLEANYEFTVFGDYLKNLQESTILQLTALEQEQKGEDDAANATNELAGIAQARADAGMKFSALYSDPRYAPQGDDIMPRAEQYIIDINAKSNEIVAQQNESADAYARWNRKADSYITALTILAVAFFLFGLAQAVKNAQMRLAFAVFGTFVILFSLFVSIITLIA